MYAKTHVTGNDVDDFYAALIAESGTSPKWNFHKYLIDRSGHVVENYSSFTGPENTSLVKKIESLLAE